MFFVIRYSEPARAAFRFRPSPQRRTRQSARRRPSNPMVLTSRFSSCTRKSSFLPTGSSSSAVARSCAMWLLRRTSSSSIAARSAKIATSVREACLVDVAAEQRGQPLAELCAVFLHDTSARVSQCLSAQTRQSRRACSSCRCAGCLLRASAWPSDRRAPDSAPA